MNVWQLQEAKAKLSEVVRLCHDEPQVISVRDKEEIVMMSIKDYNRLTKRDAGIVNFFLNSPLKGVEIDLKRGRAKARDIKL